MISILSLLITLIIVELYYRFFVLKKDMKYNPNKVPTEVTLLIKKYKIDMKKINYYYLMKSIGRINALGIGLIVFVITFFDRLNIQLLVALLLCIPVILISYGMFGRYLVKQGLTVYSNNNKKERDKKRKVKKGKIKNENNE